MSQTLVSSPRRLGVSLGQQHVLNHRPVLAPSSQFNNGATINGGKLAQMAPAFAPVASHYTPQQLQHLDALTTNSKLQHVPDIATCISPEERRIAGQLSYLCSQHHVSDYNKLKFGDAGCPVAYIPLAIQLPAHVRELREKQAINNSGQAFFPAQLPQPVITSQSASHLASPPPRSSSLPQAPPKPEIVRTESPPEPAPPVVLTITEPEKTPLPTSEPVTTVPTKGSPTIHPPHSNGLEQELGIAMSSPMFTLPPAATIQIQPAPTAPLSNPFQPKTSESHPINISEMLPPELLPLISTHLSWRPQPSQVLFDLPTSLHLDRLTGTLAWAANQHSPPTLSPAPLPRKKGVGLSVNVMITSPQKRTAISATPILLPTLPPNALPHTPTLHPSTIIGNLFLSSCPGKKVRLTGPVRGRGAICRSIDLDLARIRSLGVGCIVCCLDDEELNFLGANWSDYSAAASKLGLDVLRIPTPEGLAPLDPRVVNGHMDFLISNYTLKGVNVLVHCRGGVGRAGLISCCWMLKLGLCGAVRSSGGGLGYMVGANAQGGAGDIASVSVVRRDTVELVERVVNVVRRRRSVKAIETYEQVRFLVDFVEFLRGGSV